MLTTQQVNDIALIVLDADIDINDCNEVDEYIGLLLENIAGYETFDEEILTKTVSDIKKCLGY